MAGARLTLDIERRLPGFHLAVSLSVESEILVLFGASGVGKTTTLDAIAGLARPDAGEIVMDGVVWFRRGRPGPAVNLPARVRRVGYVFQHYALFPHLTALQNVAYGLWRQPGAERRALAWLDRLGIAHLANRLPRELSGGQQQRVAIARALAIEPRLLLLDEPFSALDPAVRESLQRELARLQQELGLVVIYVTHRLEDALALGHRLAVLRDGRVEQIGPIEEVVRRPHSDAVASMVGIRNLFQARVVEACAEALVLDWDGLRLEVPPQPIAPGARVTAYIRPEDIKILYPDRPLTRAVRANRVPGTILSVQTSAHTRLLQVALAPHGHPVEVACPLHAYSGLSLLPGQEVQLALRREGLIVLAPLARGQAGERPQGMEPA